MRDMVGQEIQAGQNAVWASYGRLCAGKVVRVVRRRPIMQRISVMGLSKWRHMPRPDKVMIVNELPKQMLFWAMKG